MHKESIYARSKARTIRTVTHTGTRQFQFPVRLSGRHFTSIFTNATLHAFPTKPHADIFHP